MNDDRPTVIWDEERARQWVSHLGTRELQLEPVLGWLFDRARLRPGERVLDIGCGGGATTGWAARAVTASGRVTGVDVAATMLDAARERVRDPQVDWLCADAEVHPFSAAGCDVVISRFGVMFFADTTAAFTNLARATVPGGRLALAVWRPPTESPFFDVPFETAVRTLDRLGVPYTDMYTRQGDASLGRTAYAERLLTAAGWTELTFTGHDEPLYLGGPGPIEAITEAAIDHGPVRILLADQPPEVLDAIRQDLRQMIIERHDGTGLPLPAGVVIIDGRRRAV